MKDMEQAGIPARGMLSGILARTVIKYMSRNYKHYDTCSK